MPDAATSAYSAVESGRPFARDPSQEIAMIRNTQRSSIALALCALVALAPQAHAARPARKSDVRSSAERAGPRNEPHPVESFLKRASQEMFDAVATGDSAVWSRYLLGDGLFTDEEGNTMTKAEFLAELHPLPDGYHGTIRLAHPRVVIDEETAVLTTDLDEELTLYGQTLKTRFHLTSTWIRRLEGWRMLAAQTSVLPSEHRSVDFDPAGYEPYLGTYALDPEVTYTVTRQGKKLFGERNGRPREELFPLGGDHFYRRGAPRGEKIFTRDASGHVTQMIDRRDNNDLVWKRTE
jgi:hypothetical protein